MYDTKLLIFMDLLKQTYTATNEGYSMILEREQQFFNFRLENIDKCSTFSLLTLYINYNS
ncbi:hypothetical protein DERP_001144 [Dermatophagoides pteronyssinus]|uniref:Uncharacterized protein n=1 Tax=Dermatophagoides pteronyssinus TaxID=6956 RepID=A0ABQ8JDN2_DERPT|nr:hypothetical protein DERP_001144 [Dermatophagoides pteronyssinus]